MIDLHVYLYFLSLSCDVNKKWIGFMAQQALILLVDEIGYKKKVYNVSTSIFLLHIILISFNVGKKYI